MTGSLVAEIPQYVVDIGIGAGVIVGVLGAAAQLYKVKLVRWLWKYLFLNPWRLLVANPVAGWFARIVSGVTAPQFAEVKANAKEQHDEQNVALAGINERLDNGAVAIDGLRSAVEDHTQKFIALEQRSVSVTVTDTTTTTTETPTKDP
jgi:hypothetical protein